MVDRTGAGKLIGDTELVPVEGQLTVLGPRSEVNDSVGSLIPRGSGIVLGHVRQPGIASPAIYGAEVARVVGAIGRSFDRPRPSDPNARQASYRPPANVPAAAPFLGLDSWDARAGWFRHARAAEPGYSCGR